MRIGYLECFSGISGDMLLGALVDAGVPFALLEQTAASLNLGAHLEVRKVSRAGLAGTKVDVVIEGDDSPAHDHAHATDGQASEHAQVAHSHAHDHDHEHAHQHDDGTAHSHANSRAAGDQHHRSLTTILGIIDRAPIAAAAKARASRAFQLLGEAEAHIHSMPIEQVHFHEVGAVDTIVDIVCSAVGCADLGIDRWLASPLNVGSGTVECAHGTLPVPAPATLALLRDAPMYAAGPPMERISASGYGAGGRDTPGQANLLRLLVGEEADQHSATEPIAIVETVIDDSTPQLIAYVSEVLLEAGAWDVYRTPVQMKKGRTGVQLTVLCHPDKVPALRDLLFRETTTIGMHWRIENKVSLAREFKEVQTEWGPVRIKIARWPSGEIANASPEYEDCRRLAAANSVSLKQVTEQATRMFAAAREKER
jgi:pyridinium-3,5-bisthiocarboxylic acid mononucleotide nickel chelatase